MQPKSIVSRVRWKRKINTSSTNAEEAREFWNKLWENSVPYKEEAEWLKGVELELGNVNIQENEEITRENAKEDPILKSTRV